MDKYTLIKEVGDGTFGTVWRAIHRQTGEIVAVKKMKRKYYSWEECMHLREVKSLRKMNHPNIVKLKEVIRENNVLHLVFDYMECNLYQLIKDRGKLFSEVEVRNWCFQVFQALSYMHQHGYFHRDLKPENLLVTKETIKIADFGLARELCSKPPYTEYVSTRWYRAPEVLLQSAVYDSAVDMWAMGAIMAELFTLQPLFPGSSEADEIYKICSVIGSPDRDSWAVGMRLADSINYEFPQVASTSLSTLIPSVSKDALHLISWLCSWDPKKRPTATEVLQHPFFQSCFYIPPGFRSKEIVPRTPPVGTRCPLVQKGFRRSVDTLASLKPGSNFVSPKTNASLKSGVERKLEMNSPVCIESLNFTFIPTIRCMGLEFIRFRLSSQDNKIDKNKTTPRQPRYRPPARCSPVKGGNSSAPASAASVGSSRLNPPTIVTDKSRTNAARPPMKAGGWHDQPNLFGRPHGIPAAQVGRSYPRKVAG